MSDKNVVPASVHSWDPGLYDGKHSFVTGYGAALLDILKPHARLRILDLGCGTGQLTHKIASAGAQVIGFDLSAEMIRAAQSKFPDIDFRIANAADFDFGSDFDAVFSNAALHWVQDAEAAIACIAKALKTQGRFIAELGGKGNTEAILAALYLAFEANGLEIPADKNPWTFPSIGEYAILLEAYGLRVTDAALFERPTALEGGQDGLATWLDMFAAPFFVGVAYKKRTEIYRYIEFLLQDLLFIRGQWYIDYKRLRIVARKE